MTTQEITIESLAREAGGYFTAGERVGDTGQLIRVLKDDAPDWVRELVQAAHGGMLPDDWRYSWIEDVLSAIENDGEDASLEPDIYTADLTRWLHSRADRVSYCDDAMEEAGGTFTGTVELLQMGQAFEMCEVMSAVVEALNERLEALESDDDE